MKRGTLAAALAAATLATAACNDSTGPQANASGSLALTYAGARSGTISVNGALQKASASSFVKQPFAAGVRLTDGAQNFVGIVAYLPVTSTTGHEVLLLFPSSAAGTTLDLTENCTAGTCPIGVVAFDSNPDLAQDDSDPFYFTTGTLRVNTISSTRITGTFSGTAEDFGGTRAITVTGGAFDVPLVEESQFPSASRSAPTPAFQRLRRGVAPK
jgi:hypothetical protein